MLRLDADGYAPTGTDTTGDEDLGGLLLRPAAMKKGRVTANGKPVAKAIVHASRNGRLDVKTDEEGRYSLPDPAVWSPAITVVHPDYATFTLDQGQNGPAVSLDVKLTTGITVRGRVLGPDGKTGAKASLFVDGIPAGESGDDGSFTLSRLPATWKELRASSGDLVARAGRSASGTLRLTRAITLRGTVLDVKSGVPVPEAFVWVQPGDDYSMRSAVITDARGKYSVPAMLPGIYTLSIAHPSYGSANMRHALTAATQEKNFYVQRTARVTGFVTDDERRPVGAATIRVTPRSRNYYASEMPAVQVSAPDGRYSTRVTAWTIEAGDLDVSASRSGYATSPAGPHTVTYGETKRVDLTLSAGVAFRGRVTNAEGEPLRGVAVATVEVINNMTYQQFWGNWSELPVTDADGKFSIRLKPGTYAAFFHVEGFAPRKVGDVKVAAASDPIEVKLDPAASISGRVVSASGEALADYDVSVFVDGPRIQVKTDTAGRFVLNGLPEQVIGVNVSDPEQKLNVQRQIKAPAENVTIEMLPVVRVSGRVVAKGGAAVTDYEIDVTEPQQGEMYWGSSERPQQVHDSEGQFTIEQVAVRPSDLSVRAPGYVQARVPLQLVQGKDVENVEITLDRAGSVRGRVTNASGAPVDRVWVGPEGPASQRRNDYIVTDGNGEYSIDTVPLGDAVISFSKRGYVAVKKPVVIDGGEVRLDVQLSTGKTLNGRVVSSDGAPVAEATVYASTPANDGSGGSVTSDASGRFHLEGLAAGIFTVRASRKGFVDGTVENVNIETAGDITVTLAAGATITGKVVGMDASRFREVIIIANGAERGARATASPDSAGNYRMEGAPTGKIGMRAVARGGNSRVSDLVEIETENGGTYKIDLEFKAHNTVRGRVSRRGVPLRSGHISFGGKVVRSGGAAAIDEQGNYELEGVPSDDYDVMVRDYDSNFNYLTTRTITQSQTLDIDMNPATITGRIVNDATDEPIADADVVLELPSSEYSWLKPAGRSATDGRVLIENVPAGTYDLRVSREGFASHLATQTIGEGANVVLQLRLKPSEGLVLRVIDARTGQPVSGWIAARTSNGAVAWSGWASSRPDGSVVVPVPPGSYRLNVIVRGLASTYVTASSPGTHALQLRPGGILDIASRGGTVRGRIATSDGSTYNTEATSLSGEFRVMDGTRVTDIAAGSYMLQLLDAAGNVTKSVPFEIHEGQVTKVTAN